MHRFRRAQGVYFIELEDGVVVVKPSRSLASELFASLLASHMEVFTPPWRLVRMTSDEAQEMHTHFKRADPSWSILYNLFDMAYNMITVYIGHAVALDHLKHTPNAAVHLTPAALQALGRMLAVDALLNNGYRRQ